jgi:hypothetical protein
MNVIIENRFKILGGWIYNNSRETPASNKVWYVSAKPWSCVFAAASNTEIS